MIVNELHVRLGDVTVGTLAHLSGDRTTLIFDSDYLEMRNRPILGLSFLDDQGGIIEEQRVTTRKAPPYFSNLLPEGHLRSYLAGLADVNETRDFPLLYLAGGDLPGAVQLIPSRPWTSDEGAVEGSGPDQSSVLRFSLAGVQLKFSAVMEARGGLTIPAQGAGGDWIVKLPSAHYPGVPENEYSMMSIAATVGIEIPEVRLVPMRDVQGIPGIGADAPLADAQALAIRRFDRSQGRRIHTEDFAQVFNQYPERKYQKFNYANIGRILAVYADDLAVDQFARRLIYSALIGNADMHLKNWSLIYRDGITPALSPAYDMLSTVAHMGDPTMALRLGKGKAWNTLTLDDFSRLADRMGVAPAAILEPVEETIELFRSTWKGLARNLPVSQGVSEAIEEQLARVPAVAAPRSAGRMASPANYVPTGTPRGQPKHRQHQ
ncbi:MAG: type II toxin-antitoxin system HipA family toxin [Gammaproteobacteria bacterium]|nr:type II toxin-antitoxin system HipA family toxin [Gammaproteobacteria bacterium]MYK29098.1 type II toxin-antitoxin system HipA family toxin [Gammaproteobacteria bacterium]MYK83191.1 type II toxin-antitoxin system HipA family toxin [Gammaproteobacteria bacterium]